MHSHTNKTNNDIVKDQYFFGKSLFTILIINGILLFFILKIK